MQMHYHGGHVWMTPVTFALDKSFTNLKSNSHSDCQPAGSVNKIKRNVKTPTWMEEISNSQIREAQLKDPYIGYVMLHKETSQPRPAWSEVSHLSPKIKTYLDYWDQLCIIDGVLFRKVHDPPKGNLFQLLAPKVYQSRIMESLHADVTSGHLGVNRTFSRLKDRFFWPDMRNDVSTFVRQCFQCQLRKGAQKKSQFPMQQYLVSAPLERITIDIMGPLPESRSGNRYILVVGDYFSKWIDAWAMPDMETSHYC